LYLHERNPQDDLLELILERTENIMATLQEVKDAIAAEGVQVTEKINELMAEIQALKDQIASGSAVTPEQLDELLAAVEAIFSPAVPPVVP